MRCIRKDRLPWMWQCGKAKWATSVQHNNNKEDVATCNLHWRNRCSESPPPPDWRQSSFSRKCNAKTMEMIVVNIAFTHAGVGWRLEMQACLQFARIKIIIFKFESSLDSHHFCFCAEYRCNAHWKLKRKVMRGERRRCSLPFGRWEMGWHHLIEYEFCRRFPHMFVYFFCCWGFGIACMHGRSLVLFLFGYACNFYSILHIYGSENDTNDSGVNACCCVDFSQVKNACKIMAGTWNGELLTFAMQSSQTWCLNQLLIEPLCRCNGNGSSCMSICNRLKFKSKKEKCAQWRSAQSGEQRKNMNIFWRVNCTFFSSTLSNTQISKRN